MNTETLLLEANKLVNNLDSLLWDLSMAGDQQNYDRVDRIHIKSLKRYQRRYDKWNTACSATLMN